MKTLCFTILSLLCFSFPIISQNTISAGISLTIRHYEFNYDYPNPSSVPINSEKTGKISLTKFPMNEVSFQHFSENGNFSQFSLYGWSYNNNNDDIVNLIQESSGLIVPTNGSKLSQASIGLRFRQGLKAGDIGNNLSVYIFGSLGSFFQNIQKTPKTIEDIPVTINNISIEMGTGVYVLKHLGQHAFLTFGLPIPVYQMDIEVLDVQDPSLTFDEQRRKQLIHNFDFWKRMGIEIGAGLFF